MIPRTTVSGTEGLARAAWVRTSSKERWWCSVGCSLPPHCGARCPTWCSAHSPRYGFLRPSVGFTQVSPTPKNCSNGRFRQHSSQFGSEASALEMRRAQALGGSSPSASAVAMQRLRPRCPLGRRGLRFGRCTGWCTAAPHASSLIRILSGPRMDPPITGGTCSRRSPERRTRGAVSGLFALGAADFPFDYLMGDRERAKIPGGWPRSLRCRTGARCRRSWRRSSRPASRRSTSAACARRGTWPGWMVEAARAPGRLAIIAAHAPGAPETGSLTRALQDALHPEVAVRRRSIAAAIRRDGAEAPARRRTTVGPGNPS